MEEPLKSPPQKDGNFPPQGVCMMKIAATSSNLWSELFLDAKSFFLSSLDFELKMIHRFTLVTAVTEIRSLDLKRIFQPQET